MLSSRIFAVSLLNVVAFFVLFALLPVKGAWAQIANTIQMTASRDSLKADGYSRAVITAEVRDRSGALVPDGTQVRFSVTLGTIDPIAATESGRARVNLTSPALTGPGVGVVTATSGQAFREYQILYLIQGQTPPERANVIPMEAEYISYSADHGVLEGLGRVVIRIGKLTLLADRAQINVSSTTLIAESGASSLGLTLTDGKTTWLGQHLVYDGVSLQGVIEQNGKAFQFVGPPLIKEKAVKSVPPNAFVLTDLEDTSMWITAKRVSLFPRQRIHFWHAVLRPDGRKFLTLPYYNLQLALNGNSEQIIGFGTQGVTLDLPYYVNLTDHSETTIRLGWNKIEGSYGVAQPGFGLDFRHQLFVGEHGEETINLSRFTSSDWGAWYRHSRNWSQNLQTSAYAEYPDHRDVFTAGNLYWQGKDLSGALSASASLPKNRGDSYVADTSVETRPVPLGDTGWRYSFISATGVTTGSGITDEFRQSLQVRGSLPSWRWGRNTTSSATITGGRILAGNSTGATADAVFNVNQRFGMHTQLGLNYSYYYRPNMGDLTSKDRVGGQFSTYWPRTNFFTTASRTLDGRQMTLVNDFTYEVLPKSHMTLGLRYTYFNYLKIPFEDDEISLSYPAFKRPLTVYWSKQQHRILFEYSQASF